MRSDVRIVADENIPYVREAFGTLGRVRVTGGREMTSAAVKDADVLLVRSVTAVNEALLAGSKVSMVATATIGTDHVDEEYLATAGISFASAAGSNANSVAEYVVAALLTLADRGGFALLGQTIGIIGVGNVGGKVASKCQALGMTVLKNDPPLKEQTGSHEYVELDELLAASDVITLHVPLTAGGRWPTHHMVDEAFLNRIERARVLLNTSRGAVVDEPALGRALRSGPLQAVLDVWENEPDIDVDLLDRGALATPHISGYSFDGKVNGTEMLYQAACKFLGEPLRWDPRSTMPAPPVAILPVDLRLGTDQAVVRWVVKQVYDIEEDDRRLRAILTRPEDDRGRHFDRLRKEYPMRREFFNTTIEFASSPSPSLSAMLAGLGFNVSAGRIAASSR